MAELTPQQIEAARKRGAGIEVIPKIVDVQGLIEQFRDMIASNNKAQVVVLAALREITDTIRGKKMQGTDVTKIVTVLEDLKECYIAPQHPDYVVDFERDEQRGLIKTGIRIRVVRNES